MRLPWRGTGVWLMGDTHVHHRQSGLGRVVEEASRFGCDYLAFTEHAHYREYVEPQVELMEQALRAHPGMILVNGVEWNSPAGDETRAEQIGLLWPGGSGGASVLWDFLSRFDIRVAGIPTGEETFLEALRLLGRYGHGEVRPTVILTHPHRPQAAFTARQLRRALEAGPALAALCGSSRPPQLGRWEVWPWVAEVGGVYDTLLAQGHRIVSLAESHFHQHVSEGGSEYWPGELRRNYIYCPQRSEAGLLRGLRSGASYFVLGGVVEEVEFTAADGRESISMGESLGVAPGRPLEVSVGFVEHSPIEGVELIGNPRGRVEVVARARGEDLGRSAGRACWTVSVEAPSLPCYLRARGWSPLEEPYPLTGCFYTNPLWLIPAQ